MAHKLERLQLILEALCLVMCANGRASRDEQHSIRELMKRLNAPWSEDETKSKVKQFLLELDSAKFKQSLNDVCKKIPQLLKPQEREVLLKCIDSLAKSDGSVDEKEWKVRDRITAAINQAGNQPEPSRENEPAKGSAESTSHTSGPSDSDIASWLSE